MTTKKQAETGPAFLRHSGRREGAASPCESPGNRCIQAVEGLNPGLPRVIRTPEEIESLRARLRAIAMNPPRKTLKDGTVIARMSFGFEDADEMARDYIAFKLYPFVDSLTDINDPASAPLQARIEGNFIAAILDPKAREKLLRGEHEAPESWDAAMLGPRAAEEEPEAPDPERPFDPLVRDDRITWRSFKKELAAEAIHLGIEPLGLALADRLKKEPLLALAVLVSDVRAQNLGWVEAVETWIEAYAGEEITIPARRMPTARDLREIKEDPDIWHRIKDRLGEAHLRVLGLRRRA